jgi:hypothetical protein
MPSSVRRLLYSGKGGAMRPGQTYFSRRAEPQAPVLPVEFPVLFGLSTVFRSCSISAQAVLGSLLLLIFLGAMGLAPSTAHAAACPTSITVASGGSTTIDANLCNDFGTQIPSLWLVTPPSHGTATLSGADESSPTPTMAMRRPAIRSSGRTLPMSIGLSPSPSARQPTRPSQSVPPVLPAAR